MFDLCTGASPLIMQSARTASLEVSEGFLESAARKSLGFVKNSSILWKSVNWVAGVARFSLFEGFSKGCKTPGTRCEG